MKHGSCILSFLLVLVLAVGMPALAGVPDFVTYSGRLTDGTAWGQSQTVDLTFRIYDKADGGTLLHEQVFDNAAVEDGYFSIMLTGVAEVFGAHDATWITVCIGQGCLPADDLKPRQQVGSVPYAMKASIANEAELANGAQVFQVQDFAAIGMPPDPQWKLAIEGPMRIGEAAVASTNWGNIYCASGPQVVASLPLSAYTNYVRVLVTSGLCHGEAALVEMVWNSYSTDGSWGDAKKVTALNQYGALDLSFKVEGKVLKLSVACGGGDWFCYNVKVLVEGMGVGNVGF